MDAVHGGSLQRALLQELEWLRLGSEDIGPAHIHAANLQGMLFRLRLSNDVCFYADVWRRICRHKAVWEQVEILVQDAYADWRAGHRGVGTVGLREPFPEKTAQRVRSEYFANFYDAKQVHPEDRRRRKAAVTLGTDAPALPDGLEAGNLPLADEQRRGWFWTLIQLCPETIVASRRMAEAWTKAAGISLGSSVFYAKDEDEDRYFVELSTLLISRVIPMRWFAMIPRAQRDALLVKPSRGRLPLASWDEWHGAVTSFQDPDRPPGVIVDEAARALVNAGYPDQSLRLIDAYLPNLQDLGQDVAHLYHDQVLAYQDLGRPTLALQAARRLREAAARDDDSNLEFIADLCIMDLKIKRGSNPSAVFQKHWEKLLPKARSAPEAHVRLRRLIWLSSECDRAGQRKEAEQALLLAQEAAQGDTGLVQLVIEHDMLRDALGGTAHNKTAPPMQPGLLGTAGFQDATYDDLVERYYQSYPEERPN